MKKSILISGVGGQGTLLASRLIGTVALHRDYDIKVSEVHGMSQRGGSVITYVKYSDESVYSPIMDSGEADVMLAFEVLEAYRNIHFLKKDGLLIVNTHQINPMPVITGEAEYPENIIQKLEDMGVKLKSVDALSLAAKAGMEKAVNNVLIGMLAKEFDFSKDEWIRAMKEIIPYNLLPANEQAFELGYNV